MNHYKKIVAISTLALIVSACEQKPVETQKAAETETSTAQEKQSTKLAIEKYLALFNHLHGLKYTILRIANPYGERQRTDNVQGSIAVFLGKALSDRVITIWGDGSVARDFVYIGDVVSSFVRVIETEVDSPVYNIAFGQAFTLKDILSITGQVTGRTLKVKFTASRKLDVPINCLDVRLAQKELDWKPQVSLEEGISRFCNWLRNGSGHSNLK